MAGADERRQRHAWNRAQRFLERDSLVLGKHRLAGSNEAVALANQRRDVGDFIPAWLALLDGPAQDSESLEEERLDEVGLKPARLGAFHLLSDLLYLQGIHAVFRQRAFFQKLLAALPVRQVVDDLV